MNKIPIVILHGWNLSSVKFLPLMKELDKRGYKVYCPDLPGFGKSKIPIKALYLSDYADFVKKYLNKYKLNKIILIGHSFGGRVSIKIAAKNPKFLHALILTGAPGINLVPAIKIYFFLGLAKIGNIIFSLPGLSFIKDLSRKFLYKIARASDFYNTNKQMRETFKNIVKENLVPYFNQIRVHTFLLWGRNDGIVPFDIAIKMQKLIKNSSISSIKNANHGVPWKYPNVFADEVEKFLMSI